MTKFKGQKHCGKICRIAIASACGGAHPGEGPWESSKLWGLRLLSLEFYPTSDRPLLIAAARKLNNKGVLDSENDYVWGDLMRRPDVCRSIMEKRFLEPGQCAQYPLYASRPNAEICLSQTIDRFQCERWQIWEMSNGRGKPCLLYDFSKGARLSVANRAKADRLIGHLIVDRPIEFKQAVRRKNKITRFFPHPPILDAEGSWFEAFVDLMEVSTPVDLEYGKLDRFILTYGRVWKNPNNAEKIVAMFGSSGPIKLYTDWNPGTPVRTDVRDGALTVVLGSDPPEKLPLTGVHIFDTVQSFGQYGWAESIHSLPLEVAARSLFISKVAHFERSGEYWVDASINLDISSSGALLLPGREWQRTSWGWASPWIKGALDDLGIPSALPEGWLRSKSEKPVLV